MAKYETMMVTTANLDGRGFQRSDQQVQEPDRSEWYDRFC